jgi:hypothetical protein
VAAAVIVFVVLANVGPWKTTIRHDLSDYYHDVVNFGQHARNSAGAGAAGAQRSASLN